MTNIDNCRIYVCKSIFGMYDECIKFNTQDDYKVWLKNGMEDNTVFIPVCNCPEKLDKFILMSKSKRLWNLKIKDYCNGSDFGAPVLFAVKPKRVVRVDAQRSDDSNTSVERMMIFSS